MFKPSLNQSVDNKEHQRLATPVVKGTQLWLYQTQLVGNTYKGLKIHFMSENSILNIELGCS